MKTRAVWPSEPPAPAPASKGEKTSLPDQCPEDRNGQGFRNRSLKADARRHREKARPRRPRHLRLTGTGRTTPWVALLRAHKRPQERPAVVRDSVGYPLRKLSGHSAEALAAISNLGYRASFGAIADRARSRTEIPPHHRLPHRRDKRPNGGDEPVPEDGGRPDRFLGQAQEARDDRVTRPFRGQVLGIPDPRQAALRTRSASAGPGTGFLGGAFQAKGPRWLYTQVLIAAGRFPTSWPLSTEIFTMVRLRSNFIPERSHRKPDRTGHRRRALAAGLRLFI